MTLSVARRFGNIEESATFAVADMVKRLKAEGQPVWDLGGGDPDFDTAEPIIRAAEKAMEEGFTHYVASRGIPELRKAIARKLEDDNGLEYNPDRDIIVTPSAKHALYITLLTILDPEDEIVIPAPSWVSYEAIVNLIGATPRLVGLNFDDGYRITLEALERVASKKTKAILLNSPNNPTGRVMTKGESEVVAAFAREHDIFIISDEIYEKIRYDDRDHISLGAMDGCFDRTITINGFSKAFAMTGWRLGYLAGPAHVVSEAVKAQQHTVGCAGSFTQRAAVAALEAPPTIVTDMVEEYDRRRRIVAEALDVIPGIECPTPEGAFYVFPRVSGLGFDSSAAFSSWLIGEAGVAVTPGSAFGPGGDGHIRISYANSQQVLREAVERIGEAVARR